jgi:eukaryotic-like serine/threonine-protein kinase
LIGKTLAHYEITALLGKGGMGEVYRARDTKLGREVALKLMPPDLADVADRLARFRREARTLASLHHPRIASLFGLEEIDGRTVLVMELVEGLDLAERLRAGAFSPEAVVRIGIQIAEGLEAAHEIGIIHRDLKPANVKITPNDEIKILDFGLARAYTGDPTEEGDISNSPTITAAMTQAGMILGTAAYMSPEQAKGKSVDRRADIWSFGVILFELLTGRQLFQGETASETMADVMKSEIDWSRLPQATPPRLRAVLERCLDRDPKTRLRDIGEARILLSRPEPQRTEANPTPAVRRASTRAPWIVAAVAIGVATLAIVWPRETSVVPDSAGLRFRLVSDGAVNLRQGEGRAVTISPDGMQVVTHGTAGDRTLLMSRRLDAFHWVPLANTEGAIEPQFSPDGRWIAFNRGGEMLKISLTGGSPVKIGQVPAANAGATWADDGFIYYLDSTGIWKIPDAGGQPSLVLEIDSTELPPMRNLHAVPGHEVLLFNTLEGRGMASTLFALDVKSGRLVDLRTLGANPNYVHPGMIVFAQGSQVMAARFDFDDLEVTSAPIPVLQRAWIEAAEGTLQLSVARNGTAAYLPQMPDSRPEILLVDRKGTERSLLLNPPPFAACSDPRLSPDGTRLAMHTDGSKVWIIDLQSETPTLVSESGFYPIWSVDGETLIFGSTRNRTYDLFRIPSDLSRPEELILDWENNLRSAAMAPDGTFIFREEIPGKGMDLKIWTDLDDPSTIAPLLEGPDDELAPAVSPNGRWMAYVSALSSRDEVYVTSFPRPGARIQISSTGGTSPVWSPDGKELFYQSGDVVMAARLDESASLRVVSREPLFSGAYLQYRWFAQYAMHPDGEHFVMIKNPRRGDVEVITRWAEELERALDAVR